MSLSGTITGSCDNSHYTLTCEWSASQNTSANTSTITANVYLNGNGYSTVSSYWCCTINGTQVTTNWNGTVSGKTHLGSRSWTVSHNSDGSCTTNISFSYSNRVTAGTYTTNKGSGGGNVTLNTIPRTSSFSLNTTSGTLPCNFTVTINKASSSFTHTVIYQFGSNSWTKANKTSSSTVTVDCGIGDCNSIPNSTSGTATIIVDTYSGSTKIGSASKTVTLYVPSSVVPSVGISVTANNTLSGTNIANKTTFTVKPTNATGSYGSTIRSYQLSGGFLNSTSSSGATTGTLGAGGYELQVKVTDSRGRTATASQKVTVYAYDKPTVSMTVKRANADGSANSEGTYIAGTVTFNVSNPNSKNANAKQYALYKKTRAASSWTTVKDFTNLSAYNGTLSVNFGAGFAINTSYDVRIAIKDTYNTVTYDTSVSTKSALLNLEKDGVGIGKVWEQGALDVGGNVFVNGYTTISGNGKAIKLGTGSGDVYVSNTKSGTYLQLKDDGGLSYAGNVIYHEGNSAGPTQGNWFSGGFPRIGTNGVMEIGAYIDFHNTNTTTSDFSTRLSANGDNKNTVYLPTGNGTLCLTNQVLGNSGSQTLNVAGGKFSIAGNNNRGHIDVQGAFHTRGDSEDIWFERNLMPASWQNANLYIGYSDKRWKMVYATNGTIQTSDKRHKAIIDNINNQDCFNMIKNTDVFSYVMLNKNKEEMDEFERIEETLMNSGEDENIKMGIMAQDILNYDCSKYVLTYSEYTDEETGEIKDYYGIDAYAFSSAIMGALKQEILYRELLQNEVDKIKQDIESLKNNLNGE